jgi:hypothetical protein
MNPLLAPRAPVDQSPPLLVDSAEAARMLSVSTRTLWSRTAPRGPIPVVRVGRLTQYAIEDLRAYIAEWARPLFEFLHPVRTGRKDTPQ